MMMAVKTGGGEVASEVNDVLARYLPAWLFNFMQTDNIFVAALVPGIALFLVSLASSVLTQGPIGKIPALLKDMWLRRTGFVERSIEVTVSTDYTFSRRHNDGLNKDLHTAIKLYIGNRSDKCFDTRAQLQLLEMGEAKGFNSWSSTNVHRSSKDLKAMKIIVSPEPHMEFAIPGITPEIRLSISTNAEKSSTAWEKRQRTVYTLTTRHKSQAEGRKALDDFIRQCYEEYRATMDATKMSGRYLYQLQARMGDAGSVVVVEKSGGDEEGGGSADNTDKDIPPPSRFKKYKLSDDKDFDSLFFPGKSDIIRLVDDFRYNRGKFGIEGFPRKLGLLLSGPSGTGKTAFVKALATYLGRHIITIPLEKIKTNQQLYDIMFEEQYVCVNGEGNKPEALSNDKVIFLMEVDGAFDIVKSRKAGPETPSASNTPQLKSDRVKELLFNRADALDLAGLLNALDGVVDSPGRVVIMSTSAVTELDAALIRPGRINRILGMDYITLDNAKQLLTHHFGAKEFAVYDDAFSAAWRTKEAEATSPFNANRSQTAYMSPQAIVAARNRSPSATPMPGTPRQQPANIFQMAPAELEQLCIDNDTLAEVLVAFKRYPEVETLVY